MKDLWPPISELPDDDNQWCVFAKWKQLGDSPIIITDWIGTIADTKIIRKYELENSYTHFMMISPPEK